MNSENLITECPRCGAARGFPCQTQGGRVASKPHGDRVARARLASDIAACIARIKPDCGHVECPKCGDENRLKIAQ